MEVTFYGAVREVTGSMHVIAVNNDHIMLDCGMFQGRRKASFDQKRFFRAYHVQPGHGGCL